MALPAALRPATGAGVPLSTVAAQVGAVPAEGSSALDLPITGVTLRAQDVQAGDLFAALPGGATHGARFVRDAIERGAVAVLTDATGLAQLNRDAGPHPAAVWGGSPPPCTGIRPSAWPSSVSPGRRARRRRPT